MEAAGPVVSPKMHAGTLRVPETQTPLAGWHLRRAAPVLKWDQRNPSLRPHRVQEECSCFALSLQPLLDRHETVFRTTQGNTIFFSSRNLHKYGGAQGKHMFPWAVVFKTRKDDYDWHLTTTKGHYHVRWYNSPHCINEDTETLSKFLGVAHLKSKESMIWIQVWLTPKAVKLIYQFATENTGLQKQSKLHIQQKVMLISLHNVTYTEHTISINCELLEPRDCALGH